jgi:hypothetical protein
MVAKNAKNETVRLVKHPPSITEQKLCLDGGALVVPVGNDAGGHGAPLAVDPHTPVFVGDVPEELPAEFVEPEFGKLEFVEPEFVAPEFAEPEFVVVGSDPGFAVAGLEPGFEVEGIGRMP